MIQFEGHPTPAYTLAFSPDSTRLASADKEGGVRLWDACGGLIHTVTTLVPGERIALSWAPSGRELIVGGGNTLVQIRPTGETADLNPKLILKAVADLGHLSDDLLVVVGNGGVHLYDLPKRDKRPGPQVEQKVVRRVAVHPPTKTVAWTTGEHRLRVWKITSPDKLDVTLGKPSSAMAISGAGNLIAVGVDYGIRLFRVGTRHPDQQLLGHTGRVSGVVFYGDGRTLASCSWDATVRLWDLATGKEKTRFPLTIGQLTAVAASPDGTRLAVAGTDGPVVVIDME